MERGALSHAFINVLISRDLDGNQVVPHRECVNVIPVSHLFAKQVTKTALMIPCESIK